MLSRYEFEFEEKDAGIYYSADSTDMYTVYAEPFYYTRFGVYVSWDNHFWNAGSDAQVWSSTSTIEYRSGLIHALPNRVYPASAWDKYHAFSLQ